MKNIKMVSLIFALCLIVISCAKQDGSNSPVMKVVVDKHNLKTIVDQIKQDPSITKEEIELFNAGTIRLIQSKDNFLGKTVGEIIESQRNHARNEYLKYMESTVTTAMLALNMDFNYKGLQVEDGGKVPLNVLVFDIANTSDKAIKSIEGSLRFHNNANVLVKQYNIRLDKELKPSEKVTAFNKFTHEINNQRDQIIRNATDLRASWTPTKIVYSDGTEEKAVISTINAN